MFVSRLGHVEDLAGGPPKWWTPPTYTTPRDTIDIYPGVSVIDPNSALSMRAAVAHEICHFHRWRNKVELPLGTHRHLDEAQTSLDASLRFASQLSGHEIQQLVRDAVQRLQLHYHDLAAE